MEQNANRENLTDATVIEAWEDGFLEGKTVYWGFKFKLTSGDTIIIKNDGKGHLVNFVPEPNFSVVSKKKDIIFGRNGKIKYISEYRLKDLNGILSHLWHGFVVIGIPTLFFWAMAESVIPPYNIWQVPGIAILTAIYASIFTYVFMHHED